MKKRDTSFFCGSLLPPPAALRRKTGHDLHGTKCLEIVIRRLYDITLFRRLLCKLVAACTLLMMRASVTP